jgi:hypothetical protein
VTFAFLAKHVQDLDLLCDQISASDVVMTSGLESHGKLKAMKDLGRTDESRSLGAVVYRMVEIVSQYLDEKKAAPPTETTAGE